MRRKVFYSILCCTWMLCVLPFATAGCTRVRPEAVAEQFFALWADQDYPAMYELLDSGSRETYTGDFFVERYTNISRGIGLQGVELAEVEKSGSSAGRVTLSLAVRLETSTAGSIPLHYTIDLSREKRGAPWLLHWHPGLIFPELSGDRKVDLKREIPKRGVITDRNGKLLAGPGLFKE